MHNLFAGILAFFMSIFHSGVGKPPTAIPPSTEQHTNNSTSSGSMGNNQGRGMNLPAGQQRFLGTVTTVNGSTLTIQMQTRRGTNTNSSPEATSGTPQARTIT